MKSPSAREPLNQFVRDRWSWVLFAGSILIYLVSRLHRIEDFPIYFFCDEAVQVVRFKQLVAHGWTAVDAPHEFLPAYFNNGGMLNLSLSVYLQGLASLIGGETIATVRATSAIVSVTGGVALALVLRRVFLVREWWSVVAFLAVIPCWFLHARTGFETVLMVTSYSWFIYFYLRYRSDQPRWILGAMAAGAATFYAYSPGQGVMLITGVLLLVSDFRYHWTHRRQVLWGLGLGLLLLIPYLRFRHDHPEMMHNHLKRLGSYWAEEMPLSEKFLTFGRTYLSGLSPRFWFEVGSDDAVRHVVPYRAHIPALLVPFAAVGLVLCIGRAKLAPYRLILIAILASPFSSALVAPMVTRMLAFVVPFGLLTTLGFDLLLTFVRTRPLHLSVSLSSFVLLAASAFGLLQGALMAGPIYPTDYGLYGIQWGTQRIFQDVLPRYMKSNPAANVFISYSSFNSPDVFPRFFGWMDERRVWFSVLDDYVAGKMLPEAKDLVLLNVWEFAAIRTHPEIEGFEVMERIDAPNGFPAFYLGHLRLKSEFVGKILADFSLKPGPEMDRSLVGHEAFSLHVAGEGHGRAGSLLAEAGAEVVSRRNEPINVEIFFEHPTRLGGIQVEANPGQLITIWATSEADPAIGIMTSRGRTKVNPSFSVFPVNYIRIELEEQKNGIGTLRRIRLLPPTR